MRDQFSIFVGSVLENNKKHKVAVLGGGSFGTVVANMMAANNHDVTLWMRSEAGAQAIVDSGENAAYLPGYRLHEDLAISTDLKQAVSGCDTVFFAVPSSAFRKVAKELSGWLPEGTIIISMAKGIESDTFMLPSQVLEQEIGHCLVGVI